MPDCKVFRIAGYSYHKYYKYLVLQKMDNAFNPGDPALEVAGLTTLTNTDDGDTNHWVHRDEQDKIEQIVNGDMRGNYYLLIGEKGTGKSSMLLESMRKIDGEGVAIFEAHADLELFRIRFGKALDFEFHEEYDPPSFLALCFFSLLL